MNSSFYGFMMRLFYDFLSVADPWLCMGDLSFISATTYKGVQGLQRYPLILLAQKISRALIHLQVITLLMATSYKWYGPHSHNLLLTRRYLECCGHIPHKDATPWTQITRCKPPTKIGRNQKALLHHPGPTSTEGTPDVAFTHYRGAIEVAH